MAQLSIRVGAEAEDATRLGHSHGVTTAASKINDLLTLQQAFHLLRSLLADAAFTMQAPAS